MAIMALTVATDVPAFRGFYNKLINASITQEIQHIWDALARPTTNEQAKEQWRKMVGEEDFANWEPIVDDRGNIVSWKRK